MTKQMTDIDSNMSKVSTETHIVFILRNLGVEATSFGTGIALKEAFLAIFTRRLPRSSLPKAVK